MRVFLIRHADPDYPNNTITPAGHVEAAALSRRLAKMGLDRLFASPMGRAMDTARYTAEALGMEMAIEPWTAELHWGCIEQENLGQSVPWDIHGHSLRESQFEFGRGNWHEFPPLNNPLYRQEFEKLKANSDLFFQRLGYRREGGIYRVEQRNREKVALFCHGGFGLSLLAHLLEIPLPLMWSGFFLPTSSVTTVLFDERKEGVAVPRCLGVGDISHLNAEGLPMQPAGIKANVD